MTPALKSRWPLYSIGALLIFGVLVPIAYFIAHLSEQGFVEATMGNWFATVVGVVSGGVIAYEIARLQIARQGEVEAEEERKASRQRLALLLPRVLLELRENDTRVNRLQDSLMATESSRREHWHWARAIVDGMSFAAYEAILDEGLVANLTLSEIYLSIAYDMLIGLAKRVREAEAAHDFLVDVKADQDASDSELRFVRQLAAETQRRTSEAIPKLRLDREILPTLAIEVPDAA